MSILDHTFFGPLPLSRSEKFLSLFSHETIPAGTKIDLRTTDSFSVVSQGVVQSEGSLSRGESLYAASGSYFGHIPFSDDEARGVFRALTDVHILKADASSLRKYLLSSFPALRGYLSLVARSGLPIVDNMRSVHDIRSVVLTVHSHTRSDNRSALSVVTAKMLSESAPTIILDLSREGRSVFDYCGVKITPPISEKKIGEGKDSYIEDRIIKKTETLSLLNISFASKVKTDPSILSPLIAYLSGRFKYIVIDLGPHPSDITNQAVFLSDRFMTVYTDRRDYEKKRYSRNIEAHHAQSVFSIYMDKKSKRVQRSGRVWVLPFLGGADDFGALAEWGEVVSFRDCVASFSAEKTLIFLENTGYLSLGFASLIPQLAEKDIDTFSVYAPSFAFQLFALYYDDPDAYKKAVRAMYSDTSLLSLLDIRYPGQFLVASHALKSFVSRYKKNSQIERWPREIFTGYMCDSGERIVSTGFVREYAGVVVSEYPYAAPFRVQGREAHALEQALHPAFFYSRSYRSVLSCRIRASSAVYPKNRSHYLFKAGCGSDKSSVHQNWMYDQNIVIDASDEACTIKGLLTTLNDSWVSALTPLA